MAVERQFNGNDMEAIISRVRDVIAVSVVKDAAGEVAEVHVLTGSSRSPKQVVRDVESAVMARLGIALDHKKISVAQVDDGSPKRDNARIKFSDVSLSFNGNRMEARVGLARDGLICSGAASGPGSPSGQMRLIADATLKAIEDSGLANTGLTLEDVDEITLGGRRVAVVVVSLAGERAEEILAGSAVIRQDVWKGVVNATLDAVNRRLCMLADR